MDTAQSLYLDLLKRCLTNWIYGDAEHWICGEAELGPAPPPDNPFSQLISALAVHGLKVAAPARFESQLRTDGRDFPPTAHTMIGLKRLDNLQFCIEDVLKNRVPGDLMETGVWRGGACIFMRAVLKAHGVRDRRVWVADSFEGLPPPTDPVDAADQYIAVAHRIRYLAVSLDQVKANFERYGLLDEQVCFLKGWFRDTLPTAPVDWLAVLRLDGDMYKSTMDALVKLYPKLSRGGYLIIDDYSVPACRQAVSDYREAHGIQEEIIPIDWTGVYWQRTQGP